MKILFYLRSDSIYKGGGDVNLLKTFARELAVAHVVEISSDVGDEALITSYDLVIVANLDRPIESALIAERCNRAGVPVLLYALYHPREGLREYLRRGLSGWRYLVAAIARYDPNRYEFLLWQIRVIHTTLRYNRRIPNGSVDKAQQLLLENCDRVLVSSEMEAEEIRTTFSVCLENKVLCVPHSLPVRGTWARKKTRRFEVIVPGRIEPRKNQLRVAQIVNKFPEVNFSFIGAPSDQHYFKAVKCVLDQFNNARHIAEIETESFYKSLESSSLVVNASLFEVTSLIDLFCQDAGIPLVAGAHTYLMPSDTTKIVDPYSRDQIEDAIRHFCNDSTEELKLRNKGVVTPDQNQLRLNDVIESLL